MTSVGRCRWLTTAHQCAGVSACDLVFGHRARLDCHSLDLAKNANALFLAGAILDRFGGDADLDWNRLKAIC